MTESEGTVFHHPGSSDRTTTLNAGKKVTKTFHTAFDGVTCISDTDRCPTASDCINQPGYLGEVAVQTIEERNNPNRYIRSHSAE